MKNSKRNKLNLIFSSFLIIGYIICTYFFSSLASQVAGTVGVLIQILILFLFGLLLFYATRVGEGKAVKRFSLAVLLLVDIPSVYIILATFAEGFPFHAQLASSSLLFMLACVALGYAIPYTFLSGFELAPEEDGDDATPVEGGIAAELAEIETAEELAEAVGEELGEEIAEMEFAEEKAVEEAVEELEKLDGEE